ncbi:hypothetical protein [Azospirillum sp.]
MLDILTGNEMADLDAILCEGNHGSAMRDVSEIALAVRCLGR